MAASAGQGAEIFEVDGRIFDSVSKLGLSNLLVTVYHLDSAQKISHQPIDPLLAVSKRVGSVLTNSLGHFSVRYDHLDLVALTGDGSRLNLMIVVSVPDDESGKSDTKVIYHNNPPRMSAGRIESFNIAISAETIEKFDLRAAPATQSDIAEYARDRTMERSLEEGIADFHRPVVDAQITDKAVIRKQVFDAVMTNLDLAEYPGRVVKDNEDIKVKVVEVAAAAVESAATTMAEATGIPVSLFLRPSDRARLTPFFDAAVDGFADIPESALTGVLNQAYSSENPGTLLINRNPMVSYCTEQSAAQACAVKHTDLLVHANGGHADENGGDGSENGGDGGRGDDVSSSPASDAGIGDLVGSLLAGMSSPDSVFGAVINGQRATKADVAASVGSFALDKGPADVAAYYDFHALQIAFEHVWKILIDEQIIDTAHRLDSKHKAKTGVGFLQGLTHNWGDAAGALDAYQVVLQEVPAEVAAQFDVTMQEWIDLSSTHQILLKQIAHKLADTERDRDLSVPIGTGWLGMQVPVPVPASRFGAIAYEKERQDLREQGERLIDAVRQDDYYTLHRTLRELQSLLNSNYEFTVFAADRNFHSVNFGLLTTYRQQWLPLTYQPGRLVKTIPLSPKEERKYSFKTKRELKLASKQAIKNNSSLSSEQSSISRCEAEIVTKAQTKTNFGMSTEGSYELGAWKGKAATTFGVDALNESSSTRKDFHEAVVKSAQDYKEEHSCDIETADATTTEFEESGTIVNPNDELSVTYLFYELQRRYQVSEQLYQVQPVVLVAQEVPAPHQITESWVIANDWIINRYLLDDSFRPALQYLANKSVGDDFELRELRKNLRQERNLVETLRIELSMASAEADSRYRALEAAIEKRIGEEHAEKTDGWFSDVGDFFGGGGQDPESAKARELAAKDAQQYAAEKAEKAAAALQREVNQLHEITTAYNNTLRNHLDNETRAKRLLVHLRNNIFYYMQAIWSMEPPDQRFLRLHKVQVPRVEFEQIADPEHPGRVVADRRYRVQVAPSEDIFEAFREPGTEKHKAFLTGRIKPVASFEAQALVEVADLDQLLGFKGNYMIFPLKEHNALTDLMAAPYVDVAFGAMDPNELSNVNLEDYAKYVCCLHESLSAEEFAAMAPALREWLKQLLADPLRNGDEIVVPTDSLFIEALPGTHPLLENFKLRHRELDAHKVAEEVRRAQLENVRFAARLLHGERGDPDVDRNVVVQGHLDPTLDIGNE